MLFSHVSAFQSLQWPLEVDKVIFFILRSLRVGSTCPELQRYLWGVRIRVCLRSSVFFPLCCSAFLGTERWQAGLTGSQTTWWFRKPAGWSRAGCPSSSPMPPGTGHALPVSCLESSFLSYPLKSILLSAARVSLLKIQIWTYHCPLQNSPVAAHCNRNKTCEAVWDPALAFFHHLFHYCCPSPCFGLSDLLATLAFFLFLKDRNVFLRQDFALGVPLHELLYLRDEFLFIISG